MNEIAFVCLLGLYGNVTSGVMDSAEIQPLPVTRHAVFKEQRPRSSSLTSRDWVRQATRELTDGMDGFFLHHAHVLVDRDAKFLPFRDYLNSSTDIEPVVLPPRSPNLNAHLERFMRSLKHECLNQMIFFGRASLQRAIREYTEHYHHERNHQGLGNRLPFPGEGVGTVGGDIRCSNRLGGLLRYYHRDVA